MTRDELKTKINELKDVASSLAEPDKTFKLGEINQLEIELEGMALDEIRQKLDQISLPSVQEMDDLIDKAKKATEEHQSRVNAFNGAFSILKKALGIVI